MKSWLRRRYRLVVAFLILLFSAYWLMSRPYPQLTKAIVAKIYDGRNLTLAQVEELVQAPPGDYSSGFRHYNCGTSGGRTDSLLGFEHRFGKHSIDVTRSPEEMAKLSARWNNWHDPRFTPEVQAKLKAMMQDRKLYGWWARNRALVIEVDENSIVQWIGHQYCDNQPRGWLAGLVWRIDQWFDERE